MVQLVKNALLPTFSLFQYWQGLNIGIAWMQRTCRMLWTGFKNIYHDFRTNLITHLKNTSVTAEGIDRMERSVYFKLFCKYTNSVRDLFHSWQVNHYFLLLYNICSATKMAKVDKTIFSFPNRSAKWEPCHFLALYSAIESRLVNLTLRCTLFFFYQN